MRSHDADAGCNSKTASRWETIVQAMYHHRTSMVWPTVNHLCMTADSSTHCYEDTLLALCYSWELDQSCYPLIQHIVPGIASLLFTINLVTLDWNRPAYCDSHFRLIKFSNLKFDQSCNPRQSGAGGGG